MAAGRSFVITLAVALVVAVVAERDLGDWLQKFADSPMQPLSSNMVKNTLQNLIAYVRAENPILAPSMDKMNGGSFSEQAHPYPFFGMLPRYVTALLPSTAAVYGIDRSYQLVSYVVVFNSCT